MLLAYVVLKGSRVVPKSKGPNMLLTTIENYFSLLPPTPLPFLVLHKVSIDHPCGRRQVIPSYSPVRPRPKPRPGPPTFLLPRCIIRPVLRERDGDPYSPQPGMPGKLAKP